MNKENKENEHIYFVGIGGTLMGSLAQLAKALGYRVSGSDQAVYPPMSDLLAAAEIEVHDGFDPVNFQPPPDLVVIGNAGLPARTSCGGIYLRPQHRLYLGALSGWAMRSYAIAG